LADSLYFFVRGNFSEEMFFDEVEAERRAVERKILTGEV
jgi:hypothetical protein